MAKDPTTPPIVVPKPKQEDELIKRVHQDLIDDYDEELEMEREDWEHTEPGAPARPVVVDFNTGDRPSPKLWPANRRRCGNRRPPSGDQASTSVRSGSKLTARR